MIYTLSFSSAPAAPGPPGPGPAGPSHRHAPTNAAPPGPPPRPIPPYPPESEREGSAPAPNRQAPPRNFSAPWAQGPGGQREKFRPEGENFPAHPGDGGVSGGDWEGGGRGTATPSGRIAAAQEPAHRRRGTPCPLGAHSRTENARLPRNGDRRAFQGATSCLPAHRDPRTRC